MMFDFLKRNKKSQKEEEMEMIFEDFKKTMLWVTYAKKWCMIIQKEYDEEADKAFENLKERLDRLIK